MKKQKVLRQAISVSIKELEEMTTELRKEAKKGVVEITDNVKWLLQIINKTPESSDTWEFE